MLGPDISSTSTSQAGAIPPHLHTATSQPSQPSLGQTLAPHIHIAEDRGPHPRSTVSPSPLALPSRPQGVSSTTTFGDQSDNDILANTPPPPRPFPVTPADAAPTAMQSRDINRSQLDATSTDFGIAAAVRPGKRQRSDTDTSDSIHEIRKGLQRLLSLLSTSTVVTHSSNSLAAPFRAIKSDIIFWRQPDDSYQTDLIPSTNFYVAVQKNTKFFPPFKCMSTWGL